MKANDLTGKKYGKWTVLGYSHRNSSRIYYYSCVCDCGTKAKVRGTELTRGKSTKCRICRNGENSTIHGDYLTPLFKIWKNIVYKGCVDRWHSYINFKEDVYPHYTPDKVITRKNSKRKFGLNNYLLTDITTSLHKKRKKEGCYSDYIGVSWHITREQWRAYIYQYGKAYHLGWFDDETEAARARDAKCKELYGENANLNFKE